MFCYFEKFPMVFGHLVPDNLTHHIRCWIVPWGHLRTEARRSLRAEVDGVRIQRDEFQPLKEK